MKNAPLIVRPNSLHGRRVFLNHLAAEGADRSIQNGAARMMDLSAAAPNIIYNNGAIIHDEYDRNLFDDLIRKFPVWDMIDKRPAVGDFTAGFLQSAYGTARMVDKRNIAFSGTSPTRSARTPQEIKAVTRDINFSIYDRSVYAQQGRRYGDLTQKDLQDVYTSMFKLWNDKFYNGDVNNDALEFNGLKALIGAGATVAAGSSVIKAICDQVVTMMNSTTKDVMPTHILVNAMVSKFISQEQMKAGDKWVFVTPSAGITQNAMISFLDTAAGRLPLVIDRFNTFTAGTPNLYPCFIISADKLRWEYIEPLGFAGPDPKLFEFPQETTLDQKFKGMMFGALDGDNFSDHFARLNVADRTTVIDPTA